MPKKVIRILVVGCGHMGASHARSYHKMDGFEIVGLVSRTPQRRTTLSEELGGYDTFSDFYEAMKVTVPDAVSINTYPDSHACYAMHALQQGAHVFMEKPLAENVKGALRVLEVARECEKKIVLGYILNHHPTWTRFSEVAQGLGKPLVMRMNLNQQSKGAEWETHKQLMASVSPMVDCGVHYVDMMCRMTGEDPVSVSAIGVRLSNELNHDMYNYGQLQVRFSEGSVGWYEAGWGPMMSETSHFVKDVIGPKGSVSLVAHQHEGESDSVDTHTNQDTLKIHSGALDAEGQFKRADIFEQHPEEVSHQNLCDREQAWFHQVIQNDEDLTEHHRRAIHSLKIVLAADASVRSGKTVELSAL